MSKDTFNITFNAKTAPHFESIQHASETGIAPYTLNRGLYGKEVGGEMVEGYDALMPHFQENSLSDWISFLENSQLGRSSVTDLGYGTGQFLLDIADTPNIDCVGYGRSEYARLELPDSHIAPTHKLLTAKDNISLIEGDLPFSPDQIPTDSQDMILANNVFLYLTPQEQIKTITNILTSLKNGGVCLLNQLGLDDRDITLTLLENGLSQQDYEIAESDNPNIGKTLAFRKIVASEVSQIPR
jgi:SAM-dependent methyltransferase